MINYLLDIIDSLLVPDHLPVLLALVIFAAGLALAAAAVCWLESIR